MPFFKVTDDDGNQFTYPAQKVYDDIELDHYGNSSRHFTGKQKQNMMTFCPVMTCRKMLNFLNMMMTMMMLTWIMANFMVMMKRLSTR